MGDQEIAFDNAYCSEDSNMEECDPGAPLPDQAGSNRNPDYTHAVFASKLKLEILPNDYENKGEFDVGVDFRIGDPNVHFRAAAAKSNETTDEVGKPDWHRLFGYILSRMSHLRSLSTVYVLVDNRDLTNLGNLDPSLQHWPAVAAWWSSRACLQGPTGERCDVVFFPVSQASGLHMVHYTWAGTFILSALCMVFPGLHIVLLDSDCVPVTLFEVEDLWREAQRLQHSGFPGPVPTSSWAGGLNSDQVDQMTVPDPKPQGVILVTEHNAEVNAGFVVLRGSDHDPLLTEEDWQKIPLRPDQSHEPVMCELRNKLVAAYWKVVNTMVSNGRDDRDMTPSECQAWIQTGLALAPFCGHVMATSLDWAVAWSLIGEWTTRTIFLPPKGEWPRQGHPKNLLYPYDQRSVPMLTWARACFEQGALPSLLALPGKASLLVLPGDGMFQAQRIVEGKRRPVILHGYGGAKKEMPNSLAALAKFGWLPMAVALVGTASSPPLWTGQDWRPILGTSLGTRILPPCLSSKECLLLLSQWVRIPSDDLHIMHAPNSWLSPDKVKGAVGPDGDLSPHPVRAASPDTSLPYIDMLLGPQKLPRGQSKRTPAQEEEKTLPSPEEVMVALRVQVDSCGPSDVSTLIKILLGGTPIRCRNHHLWIQAVQDHFDDVPLLVPSCQLLRQVCETAHRQGTKVYLAPPEGCSYGSDLEALLQSSVPFPNGGVHVHVRPSNAVVGTASGSDPQLVNIDCTGLGGHDLGGFKDYDICLRTDKHSQSIYGPSVTPMEAPGRDGTHPSHTGRSWRLQGHA